METIHTPAGRQGRGKIKRFKPKQPARADDRAKNEKGDSDEHNFYRLKNT